MKKIAFVFLGDPNNKKGQFNNMHERALRLNHVNPEGLQIDFFMLRRRDTWLFQLLKQKKQSPTGQFTQVNSIKYKNIWLKRSAVDQLVTHKLKKRPLICKSELRLAANLFAGFDLIAGLGFSGNYLAYEVFRQYGIPYLTSWHGSDINIYPYRSQKTFNLIKNILENAALNNFVSKALLKHSEKITIRAKKDVLYTGPASIFKEYSLGQQKAIKRKYNVNEKRVVGFIGNLIPIKNIKVLPLIYKRLTDFDENLVFWIIGNGKLEEDLRQELQKINANFRMFGQKQPHQIPELMNAMDVLVLPSLNEGLPRVTLEALKCGVNVVGSKVGGIPEVIGEQNTFDLDDRFVENISNRIIEIFTKNEQPKPLDKKFSWEQAIQKELKTYKKIASK